MAWVQKLEGPQGTRYKVGYRDPSRRLRYKTFSRRRDADAYAAQIEHAKNRGIYTDPMRGKVTLAEYWPVFWRTSKPRAESTQALYEMHARLHILPFLGSQRTQCDDEE